MKKSMREKLKKLIWCFLTVALTLGLAEYCGYILDPFEAEYGFDVIKAFHLLEDNSEDVIVYGSSHAWKGCDTRIMNDEYGIDAYNYACNWQSINTSLLFLEDSLRTQSPKVVFIEVGHVNFVEQDTDLNAQIYYTREMDNFPAKWEYLHQCFGNNVERYMSYFFPIIMFHDNWTEVTAENFRAPDPQRFVDSKGYYSCTHVDHLQCPNLASFREMELSEDSTAVLDKIVALCNENGIKIVFYTAPFYGEYCYGDAMEAYAMENGCDFINFFKHVDMFDWSKDFQDWGHLNDSGSAKVASYLSEYILEKNYI